MNDKTSKTKLIFYNIALYLINLNMSDNYLCLLIHFYIRIGGMHAIIQFT